MLPTAVTLPTVIAAFLLLAGRLVGLLSTGLDRQVTIAFGCLVATAATREPTVARLVSELSGGRLSEKLILELGVVGFNVGYAGGLLIGAALLHRTRSPRVAYGMAVVFSVVALCFSTVDGGDGTIFERTGWAQFGYWLCTMPIGTAMAVLVIRAAMAELRNQVGRRESAVYVAILLCGVAVLIRVGATLAAATIRIAGPRNSFTDVQAVIDRNGVFFDLLLCMGLTLTAIVAAARSRRDVNDLTRHRRALRPLWAELTAACPEIVHHGPVPHGAQPNRYLLHRTVIEIRDSILDLSRYATPHPPEIDAAIVSTAPAGPARDALDRAVMLVRARDTKAHGGPPTGSRHFVLSAADSLLDEVTELTAISAQWAIAEGIAAGQRSLR
ncbi:MAB_1171c family putative transporter [Nocardia sp. NPDC006044]|uniref:MAB_1171c family putative transporter n=1 Tax=Nocardia sp. NPDC006044 TaxID=3364306 RepID=UPI003687257A